MTEPTAEQKPPSVWEDLLEIFVAPSAVFTRWTDRFSLVPVLVLTVLMGVLFMGTKGALQPIFDAEFTRGAEAAMKANPQVTAEMMESQRALTERLGVVFLMIFTPITILVVSALLWISGKLVGAKQAFKAAFMVVSFGYFPRLVEMIVAGIQGLLLPEESLWGRGAVSLGVARFLGSDAAPILGALTLRMDVFTIWITVLFAIGLKVTGKVTMGQASIAAGIVWVLGALPGLLQASRMGG